MGDPGETIPVRKRGQGTKNKTSSQAAKQKEQRNKFRVKQTNHSASTTRRTLIPQANK